MISSNEKFKPTGGSIFKFRLLKCHYGHKASSGWHLCLEQDLQLNSYEVWRLEKKWMKNIHNYSVMFAAAIPARQSNSLFEQDPVQMKRPRLFVWNRFRLSNVSTAADKRFPPFQSDLTGRKHQHFPFQVAAKFQCKYRFQRKWPKSWTKRQLLKKIVGFFKNK